MFIKNTQDFPVVKVSFLPEDEIPFEENMAIYESLLDKKQQFVFLHEASFPQERAEMDGRRQTDHEERKRVAAWVKQRREILSQYVKAFIQIESNEKIRLEAQKFANNFIKFSGYPMFIVENRQQAEEVINSVLKAE
ncbi:hypothetical protein [Acinetobacter sp. WZC-1]|uniref:hypothetical protein n=1 Tax=Acinetobacter sp. WZC-1 TaxID=3459034 RepID=UPI00403D8252